MNVQEILCRIDPATQQPAVFITNTMQNDQIQVWKGEGTKVEYVPMAYYHITGALSAADERVLMERFKKSTGKQDQIVKLRQRLPRTSRPVPSRFATEATTAPMERRNPHAKSIESQPLPPAPEILSEQEVPTDMPANNSTQVAQPQVVSAQIDVARASPADVLNKIATLSQQFNQQMMAMNTQFNAEIAELANLLAPKAQ